MTCTHTHVTVSRNFPTQKIKPLKKKKKKKTVDLFVAYTVRDDVRVALEAALGVTVGLLVAGKVPDNQGLVATA